MYGDVTTTAKGDNVLLSIIAAVYKSNNVVSVVTRCTAYKALVFEPLLVVLYLIEPFAPHIQTLLLFEIDLLVGVCK
jgi:hypothetical protein